MNVTTEDRLFQIAVPATRDMAKPASTAKGSRGLRTLLRAAGGTVALTAAVAAFGIGQVLAGVRRERSFASTRGAASTGVALPSSQQHERPPLQMTAAHVVRHSLYAPRTGHAQLRGVKK
jgi:hypothetical protein